MRLERHKNFLTLEECDKLNCWVDTGVEKKWLDFGFSSHHYPYTKRLTTRLSSERFQYPQIVLDISKRIRSFCGTDNYGPIEGHGRDGVVVSCIFDGGDVYEHRDPTSTEGLSALRCNIMTRQADNGGNLYVNGQHVDIEVGELHCYLASNFKHYVTEVEGKTSRVLWMFGAYVPSEDWENGIIKTGVLPINPK
jgi:hypothetical protein